ncbi:MAG: hypothetical protein HKN64_08025 [Woeseiaceae bacterium]|nr:hypothetical protein [Woeseiaceae bacterium]
MLRPSAIALIVANLVPLAGVWLFDWKVIDILMLYWAENVIIGVVNILRLAVCRQGKRLFFIVFFIMHYGIFCYGHLMAITGIFSEAFVHGTAWDYFFGLPLAAAWKTPLWMAIAGIAASHLLSFFSNFIAGGEYLRTSASAVMQRPYGRVVVLHVAVIVGGALIDWLGSPVMMLVALIAAKIALDLRLHLAERETFAAGPAAR